MRTIEIAIVDDHKLYLEGIQNVLSQYDHIKILWTTNNGKEALTLLQKHIPDLLITDMAMPEMNGLEFIKNVVQLQPDIKILVVSMFKQFEVIQDIHGYILKESESNELLNAIHTIVIKNSSYFSQSEKFQNSIQFKRTVLTPREKEILSLISKELTVDEIASQLFLSKNTIETHKKNIFLKLQVHNVTGLIKKAFSLGYIQ